MMFNNKYLVLVKYCVGLSIILIVDLFFYFNNFKSGVVIMSMFLVLGLLQLFFGQWMSDQANDLLIKYR